MDRMQERPDAVATFLSAALHDLVGPVNQVRALFELLQGQLDLDPNSETGLFARHLKEAITRLGSRADSLRLYVTVLGEANPMRAIDLNAILTASIATADRAETKAAVVSEALPVVRGDASQLTFLFRELIDNALKFQRPQDPQVCITVTSIGSEWQFAITDNGIGIEANKRELIFRAFHRLNGDEYPGVGMGLTICSRIVERHGGRMWVEDSKRGPGSTFHFTLPRLSRDEGSIDPTGSGLR